MIKFINFLKKYKLIVFLAFVVVLMVFIKIYFQDKNNQDIKIIEDPINLEKDEFPKITEFEEKKLDEEILREYNQLKNKEEIDNFLDKLTLEEIKLLPEIDDNYYLEYILPYERENFIIKNYIDKAVILVERKGNDFEKSRNDLDNYLNNEINIPIKHTVVWQE